MKVVFLQVRSLKQYLASQDIEFGETEHGESGHEIHEIRVPQQRNACDCGIYMLQFISNFGDEAAIMRINAVSHLSFLDDFFISQSQLSHIFLFLERSRL